MSPATSSGHSNKLAGEIARQAEVLGRSLAVIQDKLTGCEVHIQYLMQDTEEEQTANTHKLRVSLEQCLARPLDDSFNPAKLQSDLDQALKQIHQLQQEKLRSENNSLAQANEVHRVAVLQQENARLLQKIKSLTRTIDT